MNRNALLVSIGVGLLGLMLLATYVQRFRRETSGGDPIELLALRRDAQVGEPITEDLLLVRPLPEAYVEDRHVLAVDAPRVLGVRIGARVKANQTLLWTDLNTGARLEASLSSNIPLGTRAMAVPWSEQNVFGGLLEPGDRVDVLLTRARSREDVSIVTVPLLQNLLVLSVGSLLRVDQAGGMDGRRGGVSLLVTIDQAALLAQAMQGGTLRLLLRNEHDLEISAAVPETDDGDVLDQQKRTEGQRRLRLERVN
ncbi:MAG: Flp pilus assembly protein CpaB [Myxococcota bacterium]